MEFISTTIIFSLFKIKSSGKLQCIISGKAFMTGAGELISGGISQAAD